MWFLVCIKNINKIQIQKLNATYLLSLHVVWICNCIRPMVWVHWFRKEAKKNNFQQKQDYWKPKPSASFCMNMDSRYITKFLSWNPYTKNLRYEPTYSLHAHWIHLRYEHSIVNCFLWSQLSSLVKKIGKEKQFSTKTRFIETLNMLYPRRQRLLHSRLWSHRNSAHWFRE